MGNFSQQSELREDGYSNQQSMQRFALASHMLCFRQQSLEDERDFLKHQILGSFIQGAS
jgi:hypothetical protein